MSDHRAASPENLEVLFRTCAQRLHKVVGRFFRNREDVEDIAQESLFAAYRHWHKFEGRAKPLTWLHSIVVNRALMELRSRKLRHAVSLDEITVAGKPLFSFLAASDSFSSVEATHHRTEQHRLLRETIDQLPKSYRSVLRTYYLEEMDIREGAKSLGIFCSAFKSRLFRGRRAVAELLRQKTQNGQRHGLTAGLGE